MATWFKLLAWLLGVPAAILLILYVGFFDLWRVPTDDPMLAASVEPTLSAGDLVVVTRRTEVTRGDYAACVEAGRCKPSGDKTDGAAKLPITGVDWNDAQAYCKFAGGRLPTEAEWEKAARGTDGREYPWGNDVDCARANWGNFEGEGPCAGKNPGHPVAVGRYPTGASPYGVLDMGGNVWEWVADKYDQDPGRRVVRGGSCCSFFVGPRAANRNAWAPDHRDGDLGFRCAGAR